jgi:hypothetical protein
MQYEEDRKHLLLARMMAGLLVRLMCITVGIVLLVYVLKLIT